LPGGRWQFVPDENVTGPVDFLYTIGDGRKTSTGTVRFDIAAVNDAPIANPDGAGTANDPKGVFTTKQDEVLVVDFAALLANDRDVEGDSFEIVEVFDGDQGSVVRDGATAVFTPDAGYIGDAGFQYRVVDSHGASSVGYVTLLVLPDVPLPIPVSDFGLEVLEDSFIDVDPAALMANDDVPEGSTLTFLGLDGAERLDNGKYRVTPAADFNGELVLRYWIQNEQGFPVSTTVTITVLPVVDAPVARPDALDLSEDTPLTLFASQLLANDSDADKQAFVLTRIMGAAGVTVTDLGFGQLQVTPDADFNGSAWFDYEIEDSTGLTATSRVDVTVAAVNDAPVIADIPVLDGIEDQHFSARLPEGFASDVDGDALLVEVRGKGGTALPSWLEYDRQTQTLSGDPPANFNGTVQLEIAASDGSVQTIRELLVSIAPVNDAPVVAVPLADVTSPEDALVSITIPADAFSDVDGDALTLTASLADGSALPDWLSFDGSRFTGMPPENFNGVLDLNVTASDGAATASEVFWLTIAPVNDAPVVAVPLADQWVTARAPFDIAIPGTAFTDVDGDALTFSATLEDGSALPSWMTFSNGRLGGSAEAAGSYQIRITASDGALTASDVFVLTVEGGNRPPVANDDGPFTVAEGETVTITSAGLLANDSDPDGDALTLVSVGPALNGTVVMGAGGAIRYTPDFGYEGSDSFTYLVADGEATATATVTLTVTRAFEGWRQGSTGSDVLLGNILAANDIYGGDGTDIVTGGLFADRLAGGAGNDILYGALGNDEFWGMAGNDLLLGGLGTDTAYFNGVRASYAIVTSSGSVRVTDNQPGTNGDDGTDTLSSIERLVFRNGETVTLSAPIILDLDGQGVETATADQSDAWFDIDGDGAVDDTSWIGATEAFLFLDRDGNGTVSGIGELSFIDDTDGAMSDLEGLRAFDSNEDGLLSAEDTRFDAFRLWQDRNGDSIAQGCEILGLSEAGVRSIDLAANATNGAWEFGVTAIVNRGRYTRTDGTAMDYVDAVLSHASATAAGGAGQEQPASSSRGDELDVSSSATGGILDRDVPNAFSGWPDPACWSHDAAECAALQGDAGVFETGSARLLALMRQDMAVFGAQSGELDQTWRKAEQVRPVDYFA
jgi:hypothetical protein